MKEKYRKSMVAARARYRTRNKEKVTAYSREYIKRPEVKERLKEYYLANREKILEYSKKNKALGKYKRTPIDKLKNREASKKCAARKRVGIDIFRTEEGFFWKAGILNNGPFNYRKEAIRDSEEAFDL